MASFEGKGDGEEGEVVELKDLPPEVQQTVLAAMAEQIMQAIMVQALATTARLAHGVPPGMVLAVLQGAAAGLNRAVGCIEGDVVGNIPADFVGPEGKTVEQVLAEDRERLRLLGREDRERGKAAAIKAMSEQAAKDAGPTIGFKMSGAAKPAPKTGGEKLN